jgi:hypothetical protein
MPDVAKRAALQVKTAASRFVMMSHRVLST